MNIRWKLLAFGFMSIATALVIDGTSAWSVGNLDRAMARSAAMTTALHRHMDADRMRDALRADVLALVLATERNDAAEMGQIEADVRDHGKRFHDALAQAEAVAPDAEVRQQVAAVRPMTEGYVQSVESLVGDVRRDPRAARDRLPEFLKSFAALEKPMREISEKMERYSKAAEEQGHATARLSNAALLAGLLVAVIAVVAASPFVTRTITGPLGQAVEVADAIARGDLSTPVSVRSRDETGLLLGAMDTMQSKLARMLGSLRRNAEQVNAVANGLSHSAAGLAKSTHQQSDAAASVAAAVEQITVSIGQVAERSREAQEISTQSGALSATGDRLIQGLVQDMASIQASVMRSAKVIQSLGEQSQHIREIVRVIKDIADQTNLLALNAAIEAARAGEQGRGFAVVADEVRKLADRTSQSTQEISTMIESIERSVQAAVGGMEEGVGLVDRGTGRAQEAGKAITEINGGVQRVLDAVRDISSAIQEQSTASTDIARGVERMAQMCEENDAAASASAKTAHELDALARSLQDTTAGFKIGDR